MPATTKTKTTGVMIHINLHNLKKNNYMSWRSVNGSLNHLMIYSNIQEK